MQQLSLKKKIGYSVFIVLSICLLAEIALRVAFFQLNTKSHHKLAVTLAAEKAIIYVKRKIAERSVEKVPSRYDLYSNSQPSRDLLDYFRRQYTEYFDLFMHEAGSTGAKVIVLYLPVFGEEELSEDLRIFLHREADRYNTFFVDVTHDVLAYPQEDVTLKPVDGHYSRFGNRIIASRLADVIRTHFPGFVSPVKLNKRPRLLGDLKPNQDTVWEIKEHMAFSLISNAQGTRNEKDFDITSPEGKQRVLVLGSSVAFGPYLPNHDTFPAQLERMLPGTEVINAAFGGYIITDKYTLLRDRAKFANPDIIVLQVSPADVTNFLYFKRNEFDREKKIWKPSEPEKKFFEFVEKQQKESR